MSGETCWRCRDCGATGTQIKREHPVRLDVCDACWDLRMGMLSGVKAGTVPLQQFEKWQRMQRGTRSRLARKLLDATPPTRAKGTP